MKTNSYAKNTAILFISMVISKVVGALFKIPLTNILGGIGMGYYSTAYSIYSPVFAMTAAAIPTFIHTLIPGFIFAKKITAFFLTDKSIYCGAKNVKK